MNAIDPGSTNSLSNKALEIVGRIPAPELRENVLSTLQNCLSALSALGRIHLPQDQFEETESDHSEDYVDLAPYVLEALKNSNQLLTHIVNTYPTPPEANNGLDDEFDLEFDLVDGPTGDSTGLSHFDTQGDELDDVSKVAEAAYAYGGMLRSRIQDFVERLDTAVGSDSGWPLLGELDDYQHKLSKAVQGMLFGILGIFEQDVRRDEILPSYRSAVGEAVRLRTAAAQLNHHVGRFNIAIADADAEAAVPLVVAIADRLQRFSARPEYRTMRADDKKAVIDFRRELYSMRHEKSGLPMTRLRRAVEGFSKFLESMQAINHREVLVLHDRQRISDALTLLERARLLLGNDLDGARILMARVVDQASSLVGRNPNLDEAYRSYRESPPAPDALDALMQHWVSTLQATMSRVG